MALEAHVQKNGACTAAADLRTAYGKAVKVTAAFSVNLTTAIGESSLGILQNKPNTGEAAEVVRSGLCKVKSGAAIAAGADLMVGADGRIITAATAGSRKIGIALEAATAADQYITADIIFHNGIV